MNSTKNEIRLATTWLPVPAAGLTALAEWEALLDRGLTYVDAGGYLRTLYFEGGHE